jgi:hypothetical protein
MLEESAALLDNMALSGLDSIFRRLAYGYSSKQEQDSIKELLKSPYLEGYFDGLPVDTTVGIAKIFSDTLQWSPKDSQSPADTGEEQIPDYWKKRFIDKADPENIRKSARALLVGNRADISLGIYLNKDLDGYMLFESIHPQAMMLGRWTVAYNDALTRCSDERSLAFKLFVDSTILFKKSHGVKPEIRGAIYKHYISAGFLTSKTARKMRSDASSEASLRAIESLTDNEELYPDNYYDLILNFSDSKHDEVVIHMARSLPVWMLSSLMGTKVEYAKTVMESRMNEGAKDA